jgi:hypothetical protein
MISKSRRVLDICYNSSVQRLKDSIKLFLICVAIVMIHVCVLPFGREAYCTSYAPPTSETAVALRLGNTLFISVRQEEYFTIHRLYLVSSLPEQVLFEITDFEDLESDVSENGGSVIGRSALHLKPYPNFKIDLPAEIEDSSLKYTLLEITDFGGGLFAREFDVTDVILRGKVHLHPQTMVELMILGVLVLVAVATLVIISRKRRKLRLAAAHKLHLL